MFCVTKIYARLLFGIESDVSPSGLQNLTTSSAVDLPRTKDGREREHSSGYSCLIDNSERESGLT